MSRYRNSLRFSTLAKWLALFAFSCAVATAYVFVRNGQIREADDIRTTEARIAATQEEIDLYELRIARMMDRAVLSQRLERSGTKLRRIEPTEVLVVETVDPLSSLVAKR